MIRLLFVGSIWYKIQYGKYINVCRHQHFLHPQNRCKLPTNEIPLVFPNIPLLPDWNLEKFPLFSRLLQKESLTTAPRWRWCCVL